VSQFREVQIGPCRLICADCRDVLPTLPKVDAVVTDPPYGIGENHTKVASRANVASPRDYGAFSWDTKPIDKTTVDAMRGMSKWQVIFGGNYFELPPTSCWLIWDKKTTGDFADCEMAWTNLPKAVRRIEWLWNGMIRKGDDIRIHPTQKPLGVMKWVLAHLPAECASIVDPFMGSGTTVCAAIDAKYDTIIAVESDQAMFDKACKRIQQAWDLKCSELPFEEPPKLVQRGLLDNDL